MKKLFTILAILLSLKSSAQQGWQSYEIGNESSLRGIAVLDEKIIWVTGDKGTVAKSEDGGKTWAMIQIPGTDEEFDFRDVEIFNKNEILVMSAGSGDKSNIYRTSDGGVTWKTVKENELPTGFYNGFAFWNEREGILAGDPIDGKMFLMKTKDGGKTWQRINPSKCPSMKKGEAGGFAASGSHLTVAGNSVWVGTGGAVSRVIYSKDKGDSWKTMKAPVMQGSSSQGIFSIDFYNDKLGIAVGGDYTKESEGSKNVIYTDDGGKKWNYPEQFPVYQSAVRFVNARNCISVGPEATYYYINGGKSWRKMPGKGYHTMTIGRDGSVWAAGREGRVGKLKF